MDHSRQTYSQLIKQKALELGFAECGISQVRVLEEEREPLQKWLINQMHGNMAYMANNLEKRLDPGKLEEGSKSVVSLLINYFPTQQQADPSAPIISKYAYGRDYHFVVREKLNELLTYIQSDLSPCQGRGFVDSAPVLERALAKAAGLGWIGKHSLLINKYHGSYVFIAELIIDLELAYDTPFTSDHCGTCTKCIDACPTKAIVADRVIDATKCISYHTIENKEEAPADIQANLENRIYGCDICQDVCPWNKVITPNKSDDFKPMPGLLEMTKVEWSELSPEDYRVRFKKTAFERAGYTRLKRNIDYLTN
ncbi:MAG: tRNA epoxyqueuosine(34) reductase QueG [Bacteroidia bacterium]|nr:tRNA epoxyqueuosine(34) reductase QueG [Bacteroidia bacterium]